MDEWLEFINHKMINIIGRETEWRITKFPVISQFFRDFINIFPGHFDFLVNFESKIFKTKQIIIWSMQKTLISDL